MKSVLINRTILAAAVVAFALNGCSFDEKNEIKDGRYGCEVTLTGGSGKVTVEKETDVIVKEGDYYLHLILSSQNYDYLIVDDTRYNNEENRGNSTFTIPFDHFDEPFTVIGNTTAMSVPHEITYELIVHRKEAQTDLPDQNAGSQGTGRDPDSMKQGSKTDVDSKDVGLKANDKELKSRLNDGGTSEKTGLNARGSEKKPELNAQLSSPLKKVGHLALDYATGYSVDYYEDDKGRRYALISIENGDDFDFFLRPLSSKAPKPEGLEKVVYLDEVDHTYLVSTSVMDLVAGIDALDAVSFCGIPSEDWSVEAARCAMEEGKIDYAGKYSAPDYERLLVGDCNLAIENTMILHNPQVKEKLGELGIPVIVERSSYENNPLGRLEWIKLYGVLYDRVEEAVSVFEDQKKRVEAIDHKTKGKKVAFFSVTSQGAVNVRKKNDYMSRMIEMAGGKCPDYHFKQMDDSAKGTANIQFEEFYAAAKDADVFLYNSTIEGEMKSVEELADKVPLLSKCKAYQEEQIYCLSSDYFQQTTHVADFVEDVHQVLEGQGDSLKYLTKLQ